MTTPQPQEPIVSYTVPELLSKIEQSVSDLRNRQDAGFADLRARLDNKADRATVDQLAAKVTEISIDGSRHVRELIPVVQQQTGRIEALEQLMVQMDPLSWMKEVEARIRQVEDAQRDGAARSKSAVEAAAAESASELRRHGRTQILLMTISTLLAVVALAVTLLHL